MAATDSFDRTLGTLISITLPDSPPQNVSLFASGIPEETHPLPASLVDGRLDAIQTGRDLGIINTAFTSGQNQLVAQIHSPNRLMRFSFILSPGPSTVSVAGERGTFQIAGGQSAVLSVPSALVNVVAPNRRFHNLCVLVDKSLLECCLCETSERPASMLIKAMDKDGAPYSNINAIAPCMQLVLEQMFSTAYKGSLKRFYLEAKCMELVAMRLDQLRLESDVRTRPPLRKPDIEHIHEARALLAERIADPPSLQELARSVGVNCNKLKYGFREVFGTTVFGYLRSLRLEAARRLLENGDHSVTEVAFQVGYSSLSHFARIFKQTYGSTPHCHAREISSTPGGKPSC